MVFWTQMAVKIEVGRFESWSGRAGVGELECG